MKTNFAKVTGFALLTASLAFCCSLAYADTKDTASIQILTFDAVGNPGKIIAALDCDSEDGVGGCPVDVVVAASPGTTVADAFDPAILEAAAEPAAETEATIRSVEAIIVEVNQTEMIVVTGKTETTIEQTAAIPPPEAAFEDQTTSDASVSQLNEQKAAEGSAAIVVEVTQSSTVAVPGQPAEDETVVTASIIQPSSTAPVSMLDSKNCDEEF
jgi:hypothetical protein